MRKKKEGGRRKSSEGAKRMGKEREGEKERN